MKLIITTVLFLILSNAYAQVIEPSLIDINESTPISLITKGDSNLVLEDIKGDLSLKDVLKMGSSFSEPQNFRINSQSYYWIKQRIKNNLENDVTLQFGASFWEEIEVHLIRPDGTIEKLKKMGWFSPHNLLASVNPFKVSPDLAPSQFGVFTIAPNDYAQIYTRVHSDHLFPAKSFNLIYNHHASFLELRRLGIYIEGLLLGVLLSLAVFGVYSAIRNRDLTSLTYAVWIVMSCALLVSQSGHDGRRYFEFFSSFGGPFNDEIHWHQVIFLFFGCGQSITYAVFARTFLDLKNHFPLVYQFTNVYVAWYVGMFLYYLYGNPTFNPSNLLIPHFSSTLVVLIAIYICAFLRLRNGMGIAKFFIAALVPYMLFRLISLFYWVGLPSPFAMLPKSGLGLFLQSPMMIQALGICCEAMIMALAVIARTRWLQEQLATNIKSQKALVENQNKVLEATVAERTQELEEQHKELDEAHQIVVGSLNYASRLQKGQLPRSHRLEGRFASFDSIWEPRDTIGGDLWWVSSTQNSGPYVLAVADCTGHGVPGAILSLLVSNSLERIYANNGDENPADALVSLDYLVRTGLNQDSADSESDDGCDAAIVRIRRDDKILEYAGAKIDLYHLKSDGTVKRYEPSRVSLGYKEKLNTVPPLHKIEYQSGDGFVIVTDGFTDQIGGERRGHAYGYKRLLKTLETINSTDASKIKSTLVADLKAWQGNQKRRDDVTAVCFSLI